MKMIKSLESVNKFYKKNGFRLVKKSPSRIYIKNAMKIINDQIPATEIAHYVVDSITRSERITIAIWAGKSKFHEGFLDFVIYTGILLVRYNEKNPSRRIEPGSSVKIKDFRRLENFTRSYYKDWLKRKLPEKKLLFKIPMKLSLFKSGLNKY